MKRLIFTMLILLVAIAVGISALILIATTPAHGFEVQARVSQRLYENTHLKGDPGTELGDTLELRLIYKNAFAYVGKDPFRLFGQGCEMYSLGVGYQHPFWNVFRVFFKIGYDMPSYDPNGFIWEPVWFYQCQYLAPTYAGIKFHHYMVEIEPSFTGELGLDCQKHIWKGLSLGFFGAYKFARHEVATYGLEIDGVPGRTGWQVIDPSFNFGGYRIGVLAEWRF